MADLPEIRVQPVEDDSLRLTQHVGEIGPWNVSVALPDATTIVLQKGGRQVLIPMAEAVTRLVNDVLEKT